MADLSIVIVCYKGWNRLIKCLESLDSFTGDSFKTEVIVVDNKSDDPTFTQISKRFSKFRFIQNTINGGFANGCNLGAGNAVGEYLLFLNPDTVATESEVEKLLNTARQNPSYSILSCRQVNEKGKECVASGPFPSLFNLTGFQRAVFGRFQAPDSFREGNRRQATGDRQQENVDFPDWISGSVVLIKRDLFQNINGFDEDFWMYFEDVDLCRRVRNIPGEVAICTDIEIEHNHGGSSRINLKTASLTKTEVNISRHVYISKHKKGLNKVFIQIFLVVNNLISAGLMALIGLILFFVPKIFARTLIFFRLIRYYAGTLFRRSWISPRSVNFK
jgi:GT2 family glycosyltransferase